MRIITKTGIVTAGFLAMTITGVPVLAFGAANSHANAQAAQTTTEQPSDLSTQAAEKKAAAQTKRADAKLKVCHNREKAVKNIMNRISGRGQKQLDLFTSIATKTETFYANKGKTLSNYDALVSDVSAKKSAAQTAVDAVRADGVTFSCDAAEPKAASMKFKDALKSEIAALKDYKTSVKNLIVGVKSVQGTTTSTDSKTTGGNQ